MQPLLIRKDGSTFSLTEAQYQQVINVLGLEETPDEPSLSPKEIDAILDEMAGVSASWGFSTADLLEERRKERLLEQEREQRRAK